MKKFLTIALIVILAAIITGGLVYKYVINKPHPDYASMDAEYNLTCRQVFDSYRSNPYEASEKYNGKVVSVTGVLDKLENSDSLTIAVFVLDQGMFGDEGIRCTLLPESEQPGNSDIGKTITVKGFVAGFNDTDLILDKCIIQ